MDWQTALEELKAGNERYMADAGERARVVQADREASVMGQAPLAAILTCADSRVLSEMIFDQGMGDLFVVRLAGNIVEPYSTGSMEFAVQELQVPLVVVLGHEGCGAVAAAMQVGRPRGDLGRLVDRVEVGDTWQGPDELKAIRAVEHNARTQAKRLLNDSDVIRHACQMDQARVVTAVYELASGRVRWLDEQQG